MLKSGEIMVIAPTAAVEKNEISIDTRSNWQKWWDLFF